MYPRLLCQYVLNTLPKKEESKVLCEIFDRLLPRGVAYIVVRRDVKKAGKTKKGTYQRPVYLNGQSIHKTSWYEIYRMVKP